MKDFTKLKVTVSRPYECETIPECCHVIPMPGTWVSDAIGDDFKRWCITQPTFIAAPTGAGKTSFLAAIWQHCRKVSPRKKVLLLVHRTAIATQQKMTLLQKMKSKWAVVTDLHALELVDQFDDVGLTIMSYQAFAARRRKLDLKEYEWVVFDECHVFHSDATFNPHLDLLLWKLPVLFRSAHRVYLTATYGAVLDDICRAEKSNLLACRNCRGCFRKGIGQLLFYQFPNHFQRMNLFYFRTVEEIVKLVKARPADKFLIFTARRETCDASTAKSYKKALEANGIAVAYLDRFSKETDTWKEICTTGKLPGQVLVCTSVLDCGISLHDPQLRHIVTETTDKTEFLQMIGRKRLAPNELLSIYIRVPSRSSLVDRVQDIRADLDLVRQGFQAANDNSCDDLIHCGWTDEREERRYMHLLNYLGDGKVFPKLTAYHYLRWQQAALERILRESEVFKDDSALPRLAHEWLEQPDGYDESRWLDYAPKADARAALDRLLAAYVDVPISKAEWPDFSQRLASLVNTVQKFPHDAKRPLGPKALNTRLEALSFHFQIQKTEHDFRVCQKRGTPDVE